MYLETTTAEVDVGEMRNYATRRFVSRVFRACLEAGLEVGGKKPHSYKVNYTMTQYVWTDIYSIFIISIITIFIQIQEKEYTITQQEYEMSWKIETKRKIKHLLA